MSKSRKEMNENELAGVITDQLDHIKPHLPKILVGFIAISAIVIGTNLYIGNMRSQAEAKASKLVLYTVENSVTGSTTTLDEQIENFPDNPASAWAYLLKADRQLSSGLEKIFVNRSSGQSFIQLSLENFEKAVEKSERITLKTKEMQINSLVKERALFGWARALESLGKFDSAIEKFSEVAQMKGSPFADLAEKGVQRLKNKTNQDFYVLFEDRGENSLEDPLGTDTAPDTNSGLPQRPDFTYPGEEAVPGIDGAPPVPPAGLPTSGKQDKKDGDVPPAPPANLVDDAKDGTEKSKPVEKKESGEQTPDSAPSDSSAKENLNPPTKDSKKEN